MVGFIYKITNLVNNKVYIGATSRTVKQRWKQHLSSFSRKKYKLYSAFKKYGIENFTIEEIYCCKDINYLFEIIEPLLILEHNSYKKGYNANLGGNRQIFTQKTRDKMSASQKGRTHTQASKDKISKSHTGKILTKITKEKLSSINRCNWKIIYPDGKEIIVTNLKQFCKDNTLNYYSMAHTNKTGKPCYGFKSLKLEY